MRSDGRRPFAAMRSGSASRANGVTLECQRGRRVPRLEFNETPLSEVVGLLNAQSGHRLHLASPELGRVEVSGALRADNLDPLLQMLAANYGIRAERGTDGRIELERGK